MIDSDKKKALPKWLIITVIVAVIIYIAGNHFSFISKIISYITELFMPLILGVIFALILNVPMGFFERKLWPGSTKRIAVKLRRPVALIISFLIIFGVLVGVVILVIPQTIEASAIIVDNISESIHGLADLEESIKKFDSKLLSMIDIDWDSVYSAFENFVRESGFDIVSSAVEKISGFVLGVVDLFVALVISVYILLTKETLKSHCGRVLKAWLPSKVSDGIIHVGATLSGVFLSFVAGQSIEALILGALCTIGMLVLQLPYAITVGVLVAVTAYIPVFGALFGAVIGAFMICSSSPLKALIFIIFIIILQQIEGNLIYPRLMGSRIKLPALWVLVAISFGGSIGGIIGMLFAVPLASTAYILLKEATIKREESR